MVGFKIVVKNKDNVTVKANNMVNIKFTELVGLSEYKRCCFVEIYNASLNGSGCSSCISNIVDYNEKYMSIDVRNLNNSDANLKVQVTCIYFFKDSFESD